jgi:hypothetical protein
MPFAIPWDGLIHLRQALVVSCWLLIGKKAAGEGFSCDAELMPSTDRPIDRSIDRITFRRHLASVLTCLVLVVLEQSRCFETIGKTFDF